MQTQERRIEITFPSDMIYTSPLRAFVVRLAQRLGFQSPRIDEIELVTDEICNNAMEHGSSHPSAQVMVIISFDCTRFDILVRDQGRGKDQHWLGGGRLEEVRRSMSPESERGHGIFLVETLADEVELKSNELGGTDVRMTFYRDPIPEEASSSSSELHV